MKYDLIIRGTVGSWGCSPDYMQYFLNNHKDREVHIAVCSLGGFVNAGFDIYELIKAHGKVHVHFVGMSASAATFMCMGAASVDMAKNSLILIHNSMDWVDTIGRFNKESIQRLIERLQFKSRQLSTIDEVIAQCYADRCGKSVKDIQERMKTAAWLKPSEALELGIIDGIREAEKVPTDQYEDTINNSLSKEMGLPALPKGFDMETGEERPTAGWLQKTVQSLIDLLPNKPATKTKNAMKKFLNIMACLALTTDLEAKDGKITLTEDQAQKIDDLLKLQNDSCAKAVNKIKELNQTISDQKEVIEEMKKEPGDHADKPTTDENGGGESADISAAQELYNLVKDC